MGQQLIAASTILDLEKLVTIPLIFKIADIRDISKKSSAYSKTVVLPGTKINNEFFGGLYDFNSDYTIFNPNIKTPIVLTNEGQIFMSGYMQLKQVTRNDKHHINYNVVLYDSIGNFWQDLGKKMQSDLDFTDLNHVYRRSDIVNSWAHIWTDGYYYPMLYNNSATQKTTDFKPAIFQKYLLDKILTNEGLTWSGNLKTSSEFENEIILNEFGIPSVSSTVANSKTFRATKTTDETVLINTDVQMLIYPVPIPFTVDDELTPPNDDSNNLWDGVNRFTAAINGGYQFKFTDIEFKITVDYTSTPNPNPPNCYFSCRYIATIYDNLNNPIEEIQLGIGSKIIYTPTGISPNTIIENIILAGGVASSSITGNLINLNAGWYVEFEVEFRTWNLNFNFATITQTEVEVLNGHSIESQYVTYAYSDNIPAVMSDFINPKFELKQIILDIIARYNCFVYQNPEDENDIVFNIRDEFYSSGTVLDWTNKKDYNTRDKIKLIGEMQSEEMILTYSKGEDFTNKGYTDWIGDKNTYGQFEYHFGSEFVKGKKMIKSPFVPTPLLWHPQNGAIVPAINSIQPVKGMRLLYKGGVIEVGTVSWNWQYRTTANALTTATQSGYPYAGHYDNPRNPTIDINFGILPFPSLYYTPNQTTENNLYNRYWRNTINQIADGRMVISKFNLTANDVHFIKTNPNTKLFVDNTYYYINKIIFEANEGLRKLTTIELITVEDELTFADDTPILLGSEVSGDIPLPFLDTPNTNNPNNIVATDGDLNNRTNGSNNFIGGKSENNTINGNDNFIDNNRTGNFINGNSNKVFGSNNIIIGNDGLTIRGDNVSVINGVVKSGCLSAILFNKIDGGLDALRNNSRCNVNKISSELNGQLNQFNVSLFNVVKTDNGITEEITDFFN